MAPTHTGSKSIAGQAAEAFRGHWPEYVMEAALLGLFMVSACVFAVLLEYPGSELHRAISDSVARRLVGAIAMGLTAVALFCSPWGQRSGAHLNPSVTLTFLLLGRVRTWDALFYVVFQFGGGALGVLFSRWILGSAIEHRAVRYAVTVPGEYGWGMAFWAELAISTVMMWIVLGTSNSKRLSRFTPYLAGALVTLYIAIESPLSGMSMNPARTLGSAIPAHEWTALWLYFIAPPAGMLLAAAIYQLRHGTHGVFCAKLHHHNQQRCIFRCRYASL